MPPRTPTVEDDTEASRIVDVGLSEGDDEIESGLEIDFDESGAPF